MKRIFAHIGFSLAVTSIVIHLIAVEIIPIITIGLAVIFAASLIIDKYRQAMAVPLCIGTAVFACLLFLYVYNGAVVPVQSLDRETLNVSFYITDIPTVNDNGYSYLVKTVAVNKTGVPQNINLRLTTGTLINADAYQIINADLTFYNIKGGAFGSLGYYAKGIYVTTFANNITVSNELINAPLRFFVHLRRDIVETLFSNIKGNEGAFAAAIVTGEKLLLTDDVITSFKLAGVSHLMSVSGFHLTVVSGCIYGILKRFFVNRKVSNFLVFICVLFFCAVAGLSKSVMRAAIMIFILLLGEMFKRKSDTLNSLGFAVFIICLNPYSVGDIGAVLSVLSVLSLCTLYPIFSKMMKEASVYEKMYKRILFKLLNYAGKSFTAALCIAIYTMPAMFLFFGYLSVAALVSNVFILPLGSISTVLSFITYAFIKLGFISDTVIAADKELNFIILKMVEFFSSFTYSAVSFAKFFGIVIVFILIIFAICFILNNKKLMKKAAVLSAVVIFVSLSVCAVMFTKTAQVYVTSDGAVSVSFNNKTVVYGLNTKEDYYSLKKYLQPRINEVDVLVYDGKDVACLIDFTKAVPCGKIVIPYYNEMIFRSARCDEVIVAKNYKNELDEEFDIEYFYVADYNYLSVTVLDTSVAVGKNIQSNSDILIRGTKSYNDNKTVLLSEGDIIYSISGKHRFDVRRVELWQK